MGDITVTLEKELKALLPEGLSNSLLFVTVADGTEIDVRYGHGRGLCELRFKKDSVLALIELSFRLADESLSMLNKIGRRAIIEAGQIDAVLEKFRALGFVWEDEYQENEGMHLVSCWLEASCDSMEGAALLVSQVHELGLVHAVRLPESLLVSQAMAALKGDYTIQYHNTLTDFRVYDGHGGEVAEYADDYKTVALAWILAEWELDSKEDIAQVEEDLMAYVEDFLRTFKSSHTYRVDQVTNVAEADTTAAIEVVCSTSCTSIDDMKSVIADRQHILRELSAPDWIP
jgi:hypothetical protein